MTKIYLVRHAEAYGNEQRVFQGHMDGDISENGIKQLDCLAERFKTMSFDALCSSPLTRAYKTAQAVNRYHNLPITTMDELMEINAGHWEGQKFADLPTLFPEENRLWNEDPGAFCVIGGESMRHVYDRMWRAVETIVRAHPDQTVAVVSHGCAIRNLLCRASGLPLERLQDIDWCDNTAVSTLTFDASMHAQVLAMNDSSHLSYELSTIPKQGWWKGGKPDLK